MASAFTDDATTGLDRSRRIKRHVACALVAFSLIQIFVVAKLGGSLVLHLGIIIAIGMFACTARALEHRWDRLANSNLPEAGLTTRYKMDVLQLWGVSILSPFLWIPVATVANALFG